MLGPTNRMVKPFIGGAVDLLILPFWGLCIMIE